VGLADHIRNIREADKGLTIAGVPAGLDALVLADLARASSAAPGMGTILHVASDDQRLFATADALGFFGSDIEVLMFPAWDCLPYDRVSPKASILATRLATLHTLSNQPSLRPRIVLTTINAILQRVPTPDMFEGSVFTARCGDLVDEENLKSFLMANGYVRVDQVREAGEYALRGSLMDIYPPTGAGGDTGNPLRLDFFGDELETIRRFDALSQRTIESVKELVLLPMNEFLLNEDTIKGFRHRYRAIFGNIIDDDPLYEAIGAARHHQGMEHWLPLFHDKMASLFDYLKGSLVVLDHQISEAAEARHLTIADYYDARKTAMDKNSKFTAPYKPLTPDALYLLADEWKNTLEARTVHRFTPFQEPDSDKVVALSGKRGRDFGAERREQTTNIYETFQDHVAGLQKSGKSVLFASYSGGARERIGAVLAENGLHKQQNIEKWSAVAGLPGDTLGFIVLALENGFETGNFAIITETDLLGDRLVRKARRSRKAENFITEAAALNQGDLVVHINHGIGRFDGLKTIDVQSAPHDCLELIYADGDKLYLPVENIEILSRYGAEGAQVPLDKLGGYGWQKRHAKLKKRIREMAGSLIKVAASRALRSSPAITPPDAMYEQFCTRFPYPETDDQSRAIDDVIADLQSGKPMDRLICGDVGFGKTEVALRSAFLAVMNGLQVAIIVPTTLLCRQHFQTFSERFKGLPIRIEQLSRLVSAKKASDVKAGMASGQVDIVIGTHALLAKSLKFGALGLVIVDEEQHFGVGHKERLKKLKSDIHVLTLTATPIPRTLQLAMSGLRELSLIATPPLDRLVVRTFVAPFDEIVVGEALLREHFRGGQSFLVCPRIADLADMEEYLREYVPELKFATAHGRMPTRQIEDVMNAFYDGKYDVLLATTIIESGLDIPSVNTIIVHRADMFGLAQLYQLRGRVGRSKVRAYAYLTVPPGRILTPSADKRLQVLQSLDQLGAGFTLASHDLDIRGAGNLLGEEQSGNIREVGMELYQQMLEEAVAGARTDDGVDGEDEHWSPQINIGASVLIPDHYVSDINLRMGLYRRLGALRSREDIEAFAAELIDRFGSLPDEVEQLLIIFTIKSHCFAAGIERIEAGPKGATISFKNNSFANPAGLVAFLSNSAFKAKLRSDNKLVFLARWSSIEERLHGCVGLADGLAAVAGVEAPFSSR
jgi:transcription-repair coupling factor (superfamily II helicase)